MKKKSLDNILSELVKVFGSYSDQIVIGGGVALVVSPEKWLFHKALTFMKRRSKAKICKDLYGIWYVGSQLGEVSQKTIERFLILAKSRPSTWKNKIKSQLSTWIGQATPADWKTLEAQDPAQKLTKLSFIDFIENQLLKKI